MKYFIRAVKYFFYFAIIFAIIMAVLVWLGIANGNVDTMFRAGWKSILEIALIFAVVAGMYPRAGFITRPVKVNGSFEEIRKGIIDYMEMRGFYLEKEDGENMTFRLRSKVSALFKMFEDRITMTRRIDGYDVEGLTREVVRIISGLEYKFRSDEEIQQDQQ